MSDLFAAIGLVLAIEGMLYALFPGALKQMMERALAMPEVQLRTAGAVAMAAGVFIVWLVRA